MIKIAGIIGMAGLGLWLSVSGWRLYKAGGFKRVVAIVQKVGGRVSKGRKWLKEKL